MKNNTSDVISQGLQWNLINAAERIPQTSRQMSYPFGLPLIYKCNTPPYNLLKYLD